MKLVLVRPYLYSEVSYIQLTNRLEGVPFYEDKECALEPSFPGTQSMAESYHEAWPEPGGHFSP